MTMTYAIIKTGGKQIKLTAGDNIWIEKIKGDAGQVASFKDVYCVFDDKAKELKIGKPILKEAEIKGIIVKQGKGPKISILRFKEKSNWERRQGHRQPYTKLFISEIILNNKTIAKAEMKSNVSTIVKEVKGE